MQAVWKGTVSFGLVSIAVKLYSATEEKNIRFHQVHGEDGGRIRYRRVCSACDHEVPYHDIAKGYDAGDGEMIVLTDEDLANLPLSTSRTIDVVEFVTASEVDPVLYSRTYFLEPDTTATKPYLLLRDALRDTGRLAIVKVALRRREQLAALRVREGVLLMQTMLWPDEVREPEFGPVEEGISIRAPELAMATSLIDSMAGTFDPAAYTDNYRAALRDVLDAKLEDREVQPPQPPVPASDAVDLMVALRASVLRAQARREGQEVA